MNTTPYLSQQPIDDFSLRFSNLLYSVNLQGPLIDTTLNIPMTAPKFKALIKISSQTEVWVALNAAASVPSSGTFSATQSELINDRLCREVKGGDVLHFITPMTTSDILSIKVSVAFYAIETNN